MQVIRIFNLLYLCCYRLPYETNICINKWKKYIFYKSIYLIKRMILIESVARLTIDKWSGLELPTRTQ